MARNTIYRWIHWMNLPWGDLFVLDTTTLITTDCPFSFAMFDSVSPPLQARALLWRPLCGLILGEKINIRCLFLCKFAWLSLPVNCFLDEYVWGHWTGLCQLLLAEQDFVLLKILVLFFLASMPLRHVHGRGVSFNCNDQPFETWECRDKI